MTPGRALELTVLVDHLEKTLPLLHPCRLFPDRFCNGAHPGYGGKPGTRCRTYPVRPIPPRGYPGSRP